MSRTSLTLLTVLACAGAGYCQAPAPPPPPDLWGVWRHQPGELKLTDGGSVWPPCWFDANLLVWWVKDSPVHEPLLIARTRPPMANPVLGSDKLPFGAFVGGRFLAGTWLAPDAGLGIEAAGLVLDKRQRERGYFSDGLGFPQLYRPIIDGTTGQPTTVDISVPLALSGRMDVVTSSQMWG